MPKELDQAKLMGAVAVLALGLGLPGDVYAVGLPVFGPAGSPSMVIQVDDSEGAESDGGSNDADAGDDGASESDAADATSDADAADNEASSTMDSESDGGVNAGGDTESESAAGSDESAASDDVGGDVSTDPSVSTDVSTGDPGEASGDVDVDGAEIDAGTTEDTAQRPPPENAASADAPREDATHAAESSDGSATAVVREAPAISVLQLGNEAGAPAANAQTSLQPARPCLVGDGECVRRDTSVRRVPSQLQDSSTSGIWPPPTASATSPAAKQDQEALGISLVDPIKARDGLVVQGIVINTGRQSQAVPPMLVSATDKSGQTLQRWTMRPPVGQLESGDHKAFKTVLQPVPHGVSRVHVAFAASSR